MAYQYGFSQLFNIQGDKTSSNDVLTNVFIPARVSYVVLDNSDEELYNLAGQENGIGSAFIKNLSLSIDERKVFARPLFPNVKNYPLKNEIIYVIDLPSPNAQNLLSDIQLYYINPINIWNHPHHNALPFSGGDASLPPSQQKDYQQVEAGSVRRVTDNSTEINLGNTFKERSNIHPLTSFEGDIIYEGRWGNSIRFGSTVSGSSNNWSNSGTNGDPITIIRNGQPQDASQEGWIHITENINKDLSSIYLTSNQTIPISSSAVNNNQYYGYPEGGKPTTISTYSGNQIVMNSGRLTFNTTSDHLLLSSHKTINLSATEQVIIETTNDVVLQSGGVYLGDKDATEPLLLGNRTVDSLDQLLKGMAGFLQICTKLQVPNAPGALTPLNTAANELKKVVNDVQSNLNTLKSKNNFTN
jgi:hypothetical protein